MSEITVTILKIVIPMAVILQILPILGWLERKGSAFIQDRPGPNRAAILGIRLAGVLHMLADLVKLLFKEDIIPGHVNRFYYLLAPFLALTVALMTFVVLPFAAPIALNGEVFAFQAAEINAGVLYILAMGSLSVYSVLIAGWASNNKYALLGGLRGSAQMVSYELAMGLGLIPVLLWTGSLALGDVVTTQTAGPGRWFFVREPIACLIFIVAAFAEAHRAPFDLPESESELVAGYHVEYSSMKFVMFYMSEYAHMFISSALIVTLFFGGWQIPFFPTEALRQNADTCLFYFLIGFAVISLIAGTVMCLRFQKGRYGDKRDYEVVVLGIPAILVGLAVMIGVLFTGKIPLAMTTKLWVAAGFQILSLLVKTLLMCWVFIWVRWTLPRIRYDQLMNLGWKVMLPLGMANAALTTFRMLWGGKL